MCSSEREVVNRTVLALRIAEVLSAKGVTPEVAAGFGPGGRRAVAQLACPERPARKVKVPSDETWAVATTIVAYRAATEDPSPADAETLWIAGVGR